ncbi:hypothetical protein [Micromonospora inositola]|uniref:Uncharacterized protein n=1 Tax=Micromonospora inositola TaxID=47865 RepID=A0A1C5JM81_9ACTN|nr:hypothetical protein [Micromonospora inositola]SCG71704.1 hypothetical protein GA0070613_4960 [Micromonospora inositola]
MTASFPIGALGVPPPSIKIGVEVRGKRRGPRQLAATTAFAVDDDVRVGGVDKQPFRLDHPGEPRATFRLQLF